MSDLKIEENDCHSRSKENEELKANLKTELLELNQIITQVLQAESQSRFHEIKDLKSELKTKEDELLELEQIHAESQHRFEETVKHLKAELRNKRDECQRRCNENEELKVQLENEHVQRGQQQHNNRSFAGVVEDRTALDPVLREFQTLKESPRIASLIGGDAEANIQKDVLEKNIEAPKKLRALVGQLTSAYNITIKERLNTEGVFLKCFEVIASGNSSFSNVYAAVWHLIKVADGEGIESYLTAVARVQAEIVTAPNTVAQPTNNASQLYEDAAVVKHSFDAMLIKLVEHIGESVELTIPASLKSISRVVEKAALRHTDSGDCSGVRDVVRAMIVVDSMTSVGQVLDAMRTMVTAETSNARIVRLKERFRHSPSAGGWRDAMVNIELKVTGVTHITEVQLVHRQMLTARKGLPGHAVYKRVRNAMEILEKKYGDGPAVDMLALAALHNATGGGKVLYVDGFEPSHALSQCSSLYSPHKSDVERFLADQGWLSDAPLTFWSKIDVDDASNRVTRIELKDMELTGTIPPDIVSMNHVEFIDLRNNDDLEFPRGTPMDSMTGEPIYHTKPQAQQFLKFIGMSHHDQCVVVATQKLVTKHGPDGPALKIIYDHGKGRTWDMTTKRWFTKETNISKWGGVTTNENKQVVALKLNTNATTLSDSIGELKSLTSLDLQVCKNLTTLPDSISEVLKALTSLNLEKCENLTTLPDSIGQLNSLTSLNLKRCENLTTLPDSISEIKSLTSLDLRSCWKLTKLPDSIGQLKSLTSLNLKFCFNLKTLPDSICKLTSLTTLNLWNCKNLTTLPNSIGQLKSLTSLDLSNCGNLRTLPNSIGQLESLTSLNLNFCSNLTTLPGSICKLKSLTMLKLWCCCNLTTLPDSIGQLEYSIGQLESLTSLNLNFCYNLTTLPGSICELKALTILNLWSCSNLTAMPDLIGQLKSLTSLDLGRCTSLTTLPDSIGRLESLTSLDLNECTSLTAMPDLNGQLKSLTSLNLRSCSNLTALPDSIGQLKSLTSLNLWSCSNLTALPDSIGQLKSLTSLDLGSCYNLTTLPGSICELKALTILNLWSCSNLTALPNSIGELKSLTSLDLRSCSNLTALPNSIGQLKSLTSLNLWSCSNLTALPDSIGQLKSLTSLALGSCYNLATLPGSICELKALTILNLWSCSNLTAMPDLIGQLKSLTSLDLGRCTSLTTLPDSIGRLESLTSLDLHECTSLTTLPDLNGQLKSLTSLDLRSCSNLTALPNSIGELKSLTSLNLWSCSNLTALPDSIGELKSLNILL